MPDPSQQTSVTILGEEYKIRGASPEVVLALAGLVDEKFRSLQESRPSLDIKRMAVMICLNMAEELYQDRARRDGVMQQAWEQVRRCRGSLELLLRDEGVVSERES